MPTKTKRRRWQAGVVAHAPPAGCPPSSLKQQQLPFQREAGASLGPEAAQMAGQVRMTWLAADTSTWGEKLRGQPRLR